MLCVSEQGLLYELAFYSLFQGMSIPDSFKKGFIVII